MRRIAALGGRWTLAAALAVAVVLVAPAPLAAQGTGFEVRTATHPGYARLVIDHPRAAPFSAVVTGRTLVVQFQDPLPPGALDTPAFRRLTGYLGAAEISADRRRVSVALQRPVSVRSFTNRTAAVIDLMDRPTWPDGGEVAAAPQPVPAAAPTAVAPPVQPVASAADRPRIAVRVGRHDAYTRLAFDWPTPVEYRAAVDGGVLTLDFAGAAEVDLAQLRPRLPPSIGAVEQRVAGDRVTLAFALPDSVQARAFRAGNAVVVDVLAPPNTPTPPRSLALAPLAPAPAPVAAPVTVPAPVAAPPVAAQPVVPAPAAAPVLAAPTLIPAAQAQAPSAEPSAVAVGFATVDGAPQLRLTWRQGQPGSAAMFLRGDQLYIVFDQPLALDLAGVRARPLPPRYGPIETLAVERGSALRVAVPAAVNPTPLRVADGWAITMRAAPRRPITPATVEVDADRPSVTVDLRTQATSALPVPDVEAGAPLLVMPATDVGVGVMQARSFPQFALLPSVQGVVVKPAADGIELLPTQGRIQVVTGTPLLISRENGRSVMGIFDFRRWMQSDVDFTEARQQLTQAAAEAPVRERAAARFEFAQFLVARGFGADAVGVLGTLVEDWPVLSSDPSLKALRGAARVLLADGPAAVADLSDPRLDGDRDALAWRAAAYATDGRWAEADRWFRQAGEPSTDLPPAIRQRMLLQAAEAALDVNDVVRVRQLLDRLSGLNPTQAARAESIRGRMLMQSGERDRGLAVIERLARHSDPWVRAVNELRLVTERVADGSMPRREGVERLDRLRFAWTGDALHYAILSRLGQMQIEDGQFRDGFHRLRDAMRFYPDRAENPALQQRMVETFVGLYEGGPNAPAPLAALALFDDFRDLTPPGTRGDRMVQGLADRLVEIDLLDRAAVLLDHQVKNRLQGQEKARVGGRLALVHLMDKRPLDALAALDQSAVPQLPAELQAERRLVRARALADAAQVETALNELRDDRSPQADLFRAELFSRLNQWARAVEPLARLAGDPADQTMSPDRAAAILNLAVATAMANDEAGLRRLREQFGPRMAQTQHAAAFGLVAAGAGTSGRITDQRSLDSRVADLQQFQSLVQTYRQRLQAPRTN